MAEEQHIEAENLQEKIANNSTTHTNVAQEFLITTSDKLKIEADNFKEAVKKGELLDKLALFLAFLTAAIAAEFKDFMGISAAGWRAAFSIGSLLSLLYFLKSAHEFWISEDDRKIETFIENVKKRSSGRKKIERSINSSKMNFKLKTNAD